MEEEAHTLGRVESGAILSIQESIYHEVGWGGGAHQSAAWNPAGYGAELYRVTLSSPWSESHGVWRTEAHAIWVKDIKGSLRLSFTGISRVSWGIKVCLLLRGSPHCVCAGILMILWGQWKLYPHRFIHIWEAEDHRAYQMNL